MKLLVTRFNGPLYIDAVQQLQERGFDIVYWERSRGDEGSTKINYSDFPNTIFHNGLDARMGIPAPGIEISQFEPLSRKFIHEMHECESQVLSMMNVEDLRERVSVAKRKHIYYEYLKYWRGVLTSLNIDVVISGDIPHVSFQYTMYCVAQKLGIPFLMRRMVKIGARYVIIDDIKDYKDIREEYEMNKEKQVQLDDLPKGFREYYEKQTNPKKDATPYWIKTAMRQGDFRRHDLPSMKGVLKSIWQLTFFKLAFSYCREFFHYHFRSHRFGDLEGFYEPGYKYRWYGFKWGKIKKQYKKRYEKFEKGPDFSKKYIYVPLHNQPEASTSAMGDVFTNQYLLIDMLSSVLPDGWEIYVKENPGQWIMPRTHVGRFNSFYKDINKLKNVHFVPHKTSTFNLIENAKAVASVTSFACLEALLRGKPALLFGYVWFMHCDGILRVQNSNECKNAIEKIQKGFKPSVHNILNYFNAVNNVSFVGFHTERARKGTHLEMTDEENTKILVDEFEKKLRMI
jgi:hypothetical protein